MVETKQDKFLRWFQRHLNNLPDNKARYNCSHESIGQDGADVSEKMSLKQTKTQVY